MPDIAFDIETFPNIFSAAFKPIGQTPGVIFEVSDRRDQRQALLNYLFRLATWTDGSTQYRLVGFNNVGFDWPVLQAFMEQPTLTYEDLYRLAQQIIADSRMGNGYAHQVRNPSIPQIDLFRIHHFDNRVKATSLKAIEFARRSRSVQDLPFRIGTWLNDDEKDTLLAYNCHDVTETEGFYNDSLDAIRFRESLDPAWMNFNDGKIGKQFFIRELEAAGVPCFERDANGKRVPRQTPRPDGVRLGDVIFPYIWFARGELQELLADLKRQLIYDTRGSFERKVQLDGSLQVAVGLGGMHASLDRAFIDGRGEREVLDLDVTSFYPKIAIENTVYPAHLGPMFCTVYDRLFRWRMTTEKGTPTNRALKFSLNVPFGDSNSEFGPFFDPAYMLAITINGQLLLLTLAERLLDMVPDLEIIQMNTDGITCSFPRELRERVTEIAAAWSSGTRMPLEAVTYSRMWIRDVNNYIGEHAPTCGCGCRGSGKVKRKGAYEYKRDWHQNHSSLVIPKAVEAALVRGEDPEAFIRAHKDPWDFLARVKVGDGSHLLLNDGRKLHGLVRYYVSESGFSAVKVMPKTTTRLHAGGHASITGQRGAYGCDLCEWTGKTKKAFTEHSEEAHSSKITPCNVFDGELAGVDYRYYVAEARKLLIGDVE